MWDGPIDDERAARAWEEARALLDEPLPAGDAVDADWMRDALGPWVARRIERLAEVQEDLEALLTGDPRSRLFALVVLGTIYDQLLESVRSAPVPRAVEADERTRDSYRASLDETLAPVAARALDAWDRCAEVAPAAPEPMRIWEAHCRARSRALEPIAALAGSFPGAAPPRKKAPIPPECGWNERPAPEPEAPTPDLAAPARIAVVYEGREVAGADREKLLAAVQKKLAATLGMPVIPRAEVRRAERLVAARKWRERGPVCGQEPPLPAILAEKHPHLVIARVESWCGNVFESSEDAGEQRCDLHVWFRRAGTDERDGLPEPMQARVEVAEPRARDWIAAAARLGDKPPTLGGLLGSLTDASGPRRIYVVRPADDADPWLRVRSTLDDRGRGIEPGATRRAIAACYDGPVASFAVRVTLSAAGEPIDVAVEPGMAGDQEAAAAAADCIAKVVRQTGWQCPRSGAPAEVEATVCVGAQ